MTSCRGMARVTSLLAMQLLAAEATPEQWYSEFYIPRQEITAALVSRLMQIADETGGEEGLADAVSELEREREVAEMPRLVQHATKLFLIHHPEARAKLRVSPLEKRQPDLVRPSNLAASPGEQDV